MKIAVFPGSFDPITKAHIDIVERGLTLFDQVIIAVGVNIKKKGMFDLNMRMDMIRSSIADLPSNRVKVDQIDGLTVDYCQQHQADYILRGMRNIMDFESERAIALNNLALSPGIETVFLISQGTLSHVSSTIIREILTNDGDVSHLVPRGAVSILQSQRPSH